MKKLLCLGLTLLLLSGAYSQTKTTAAGAHAADEKAIRTTINAWMTSWANHDFKNLAAYATPDMDFVNPAGVWWKGREEVRRGHQAAHNTFFKNTPQTLKSLHIRFVKPDVAIAHQVSAMGAYTTPDGKKIGSQEILETWVLVKQNGRWLLNAGHVASINPAAVKVVRQEMARTK
jgi:uncharacterized protein (TIGR02246 family)